MQEAANQTLNTAADWERELKNPQSPLFKLYVASLEKAVDEQACLMQLLDYWMNKAALDKSDERYQAWLEEERENDKLAVVQQAPVIASVLANEAMPDESSVLETLLEALMAMQQKWQTQVDDSNKAVKTCNRELVELDKQWNSLQSAKTDMLVTDWKTQFEAGNIRDTQGIPVPPPLPAFLNKLRDAMHSATPQKQCEVNPALLNSDAHQAVKGGNVMAQLRMVAVMVEHSAKDKALSFAEAGLAFIKNNKTMPKPMQIDKEVATFESTQSAMKQRQAAVEAKNAAEKNLAVVNQDIDQVNEAKAELDGNRFRPR